MTSTGLGTEVVALVNKLQVRQALPLACGTTKVTQSAGRV